MLQIGVYILIKNIKGNLIIENVISISLLCIYTVVIVTLTNNFAYQQKINTNFVKINQLLQDSAEVMLNKKYADIIVGTTSDSIEGFQRTITTTENIANMKEINIVLSGEKGEMSLTVEKGLDIN